MSRDGDSRSRSRGQLPAPRGWPPRLRDSPPLELRPAVVFPRGWHFPSDAVLCPRDLFVARRSVLVASYSVPEAHRAAPQVSGSASVLS